MITAREPRKGWFYVDYNENSRIYKAFTFDSNSRTWQPAEVSYTLDGLFECCKKNGLTTLDGFTDAAIYAIHKWLSIELPTLLQAEEKWDGEISYLQPNQTRPIGFQPPTDIDAD